MVDIFSAKKRSLIMSRIRSSGTTPEQMLSRFLSKYLGKRRRIERNVRALPGQPDFMIPSLHLAIFVDGCFYHGCPIHGHSPKSNRKYWIPKLSRNLERDKTNKRALRRMGLAVWRVWEHSLRGRCVQKTYSSLAMRLDKRIRLLKRGCQPVSETSSA